MREEADAAAGQIVSGISFQEALVGPIGLSGNISRWVTGATSFGTVRLADAVAQVRVHILTSDCTEAEKWDIPLTDTVNPSPTLFHSIIDAFVRDFLVDRNGFQWHLLIIDLIIDVKEVELGS